MAETKDLFTRLKKMFSTDVIVRNIGGKRLKIVDTDEVQYATDKNSLRDRFNRLRSSTYNLHNRDMSLSYQSARLELFRDYDVMDMDPILSSALDIYADECLSEETIIPLLDGRKVSIGELYRNKETDFWVYSVDSEGKFSPQLCERVAHNGKKSMVKVTLCDGTEVRCTQNHIWILDNGEQIETSKLVSGSKLKAFSTKLSDNKFLTGYEMLKENGKWEYTHRMVANRQPRLAEQKKGVLSETKLGITVDELKDFISTCQYNSLQDIVSSSNHRVVSIESEGILDAYDLVNVGTSHVYAIEAKDGSKVFTHNCLVPSEFGKVITIRSNNEDIKRILENLFYDILNIEFNLWSWVRNMCKYGDFFLRLQISPEYGVYTVQPISAYELTRIEGSDPKNINYVKYQHDGLGGGCEYENFEIAHFRLISDSNFLPYGKSMLEGARRVWKQLSLMEDAMLIHRIMRAPEKRIFKLDVGNLPPGEIDSFMEKIMNKMKKVPYLDERTGDYNLRFNLNNMVEDFYLPVRGGDSGTSIDTLPGMEFTGTEDIEYIRNKMMAALKIPKAFLGYEEGISGKATLAAEDVRFSRTIGRLQRIIVSELTKIAIIHLYVQGFKDATLVDFELELSNPSTIFEQEKIDMFQNKVNLAKDMLEAKLFSKAWVYHNIFSLSKVDVENLEETILKDQKTAWRISQIEEEGNDPATSNQGIDKEGVPQDLPGGDTGGGDAGGGPEAGAGAEGLPELPALQESPSEEEVIKEAPTDEELGIGEAKKRDQTGNKEKYSTNRVKNRGEDVLGDMAAHEKPTSNPLRHTFRGGSPLAIDEELKFIKKTLAARFPDNKKSVITEERSLLDESNIIEDDKAL